MLSVCNPLGKLHLSTVYASSSALCQMQRQAQRNILMQGALIVQLAYLCEIVAQQVDPVMLQKTLLLQRQYLSLQLLLGLQRA